MSGLIKLIFDALHNFILKYIKGNSQEEKLTKYNSYLVVCLVGCLTIISFFIFSYFENKKSIHDILKTHNELLKAIDYDEGNIFNNLLKVNDNLNFSLQKCKNEYTLIKEKKKHLDLENQYLKKVMIEDKNKVDFINTYESVFSGDNNEVVDSDNDIDEIIKMKKVN